MYLNTAFNSKYTIDKLMTGFWKCIIGNKEKGLGDFTEAIKSCDVFVSEFENAVKHFELEINAAKKKKVKKKKINEKEKAVNRFIPLKKLSSNLRIVYDLIDDFQLKDFCEIINKPNSNKISEIKEISDLSSLEQYESSLVETVKDIYSVDLKEINQRKYNVTSDFDPVIYGNLALNHLKPGKILQGLAAYELYNNGKEFFDNGALKSAALYFERAVNYSPLLCNAHIYLVESYLELSKKKVVKDAYTLAKNALKRFIEEAPNTSLASKKGISITGRPIVTDSNFYKGLDKTDSEFSALVHNPNKFSKLELRIDLNMELAKLKLATLFFNKQKNSVEARKLFEELFIDGRANIVSISDYEMAYESFSACGNAKEQLRLLTEFKNNLSSDTKVKLRARISDF